MPEARTMWPTAVLASALVRAATVLTAAFPGRYGGGHGGDGGDSGGEGGGGGGGEGGGGEGGGGEGGREGCGYTRRSPPQSLLSVPREQHENCDPGPPSSQMRLLVLA